MQSGESLFWCCSFRSLGTIVILLCKEDTTSPSLLGEGFGDQGLDWGEESRRPVSHPGPSRGRNAPTSHSSLLPACLMGRRPYPDTPRQWISLPLLLSPGTGKNLTMKRKQIMQCSPGKCSPGFIHRSSVASTRSTREWWKTFKIENQWAREMLCKKTRTSLSLIFGLQTTHV